MLIYNYSRSTFELINESEARLDPVGQEPLIPAYATDVVPPTPGENQIPVFDEETKVWLLVPDFRGTVYYDSNKLPTQIFELNVLVPEDCTTEIPPEVNGRFYVLSGKSWVVMPITEVKEMKISESYYNTAGAMDENLSMYSKGELDTWSRMNDECVQYKTDGTIGTLMSKKIAVDPIYNTADKLADMTVTEYDNYINNKYNLEAQRSQHKLNITNETDVVALMNYDTSVSL